MGYILLLGANCPAGHGLATKYAQAGYDIYLTDKNPDTLQEVSNRLSHEYGVDVQALKLDVTEFYNHRNFYASLSPVPIGVICAVDYQGDGLRAQKDFIEAKRIMDINYTGLVALLNIIAVEFEAKGGFITAISYAGDESDETDNYIYKSAKNAFSVYVNGLKTRLARADVKVQLVTHGTTLESPENFANKVFNAQQKGRDIIFENSPKKGLASLIKGLKWK